MCRLVLTTAVVATIWLTGCSKKVVQQPIQQPVSITYNTITDARDGQTYKTVTIGQQTWMAENLNYRTDSSWCYNNTDSNCIKYGRLYAWNAANKACLDGWHLPDRKEWETLIKATGGNMAGKMLKSKTDWGKLRENCGEFKCPKLMPGMDAYGFSALPGYLYSPSVYDVDDVDDALHCGYWWTATEYSDSRAYYRVMFYCSDLVYEDYYFKSYGFSVRCIQNSP